MENVVRIGEREFSVPKLRVGTLERVSKIIAEIDGIDPKSQNMADIVRWFDAHARAIHELLRRAYPDLELSALKDLIDTDAVADAFMQTMAAAGRKVDDKGEAKGP